MKPMQVQQNTSKPSSTRNDAPHTDRTSGHFCVTRTHADHAPREVDERVEAANVPCTD